MALRGNEEESSPCTMKLVETRRMSDAFKAMPVKTDRNDAQGIADQFELGCVPSESTCKSIAAQEMRAMLSTARKLVHSQAAQPGEQPARDFAWLWAESR